MTAIRPAAVLRAPAAGSVVGPAAGVAIARLRAVLDASLAASLLLVTVLLFWFGYRATREWERSNLEATERRGNEVLMLLGTALERDMRGAFTTALLPFNVMTLQERSRYDLADRFAVAFARFPYVESFFVWRRSDSLAGSSYFFNRADLPPPWDRISEDDDVFPVLIRDNPAAARPVIERGPSRGRERGAVCGFRDHGRRGAVPGVRSPALRQCTARRGDLARRLHRQPAAPARQLFPGPHPASAGGDRGPRAHHRDRGRPRRAGGANRPGAPGRSDRPQEIPAAVCRSLSVRVPGAGRA